MDIRTVDASCVEKLRALGFEAADGGAEMDLITLLSFLPEEVEDDDRPYDLYIDHTSGQWEVGYAFGPERNTFFEPVFDEDLATAVFKFVCWARINDVI